MIDIKIWIALAAICFIGEMITTSFFLLWFGIGASITAVLNYLGFDPMIQFVAFIIISLILLGISRPFAARITSESPKKAASDRLIGKEAIVIEEILEHEGGLVDVDGDVWRAVAPQKIQTGELVKIESVQGVKLCVKTLDNE
ncbi:NfeD family protein [Methanobacterium alcaliphilum]|uniref:NfeD family protein n=1 Tax=Methanobacterium alcaliphilum TaxID=392018 RepID=UPI00200B9FA9|nr:NfeD family protein [Methanobacterium alcaliphilum]MCK9152075.1 NfeD family protein [Methanobacterium alcaliphilum]